MPRTLTATHRFGIACSVALGCILSGLLFASASALAATPPVLKGEFNGSKTPCVKTKREPFEPLSVAAGVGVNTDVYVADGGCEAVYIFEASGKYVGELHEAEAPVGEGFASEQIVVDPSTGDVWVSYEGGNAVYEFSPSGTYLGKIAAEAPGGLAFNSSGDMYVIDVDNSYIYEYSESGTELVPPFTGSESNFYPGTLAVAPDGDVYAADETNDVVDEFTSSGTYIEQLTIPAPPGTWGIYAIAIDPSSGDIYVDDYEHGVVDEFSEAGTYLTQFNGNETAAESFEFIFSLAATSNGDVYLANLEGNAVDVYGPVTATEYTLTVTPEGTGAGSVKDSEAKIDCSISGGTVSGTCSEKYAEGKTVTLTESTLETFSGWTAGCESNPTPSECVVQMSKAQSVTAKFTHNLVPEYVLNIDKAGSGSGSVTFSCQVDGGSSEGCKPEYPENSEVLVTAATAAGSTFAGWGGECESTSGLHGEKCKVELTGEKTVTATAKKNYTLTLTKAGSGTDEVKCEVEDNHTFEACAGEYVEGTKLTLEVTAAMYSEFKGWSAAGGSAPSSCDGTTSDCSFTLGANSALTWTVEPQAGNESFAYVITGSGTLECKVGAGTFGACASTYTEGDQITLKEIPGQYHSFAGWSNVTGSATGHCTGTSEECTFTITETTSVEVPFTQNTHTVTVTPLGEGAVSAGASPTPVSGSIAACSATGGTCTATYDEDAGTVTLTATPKPHYKVKWTNCTSVPSENECKVTVGSANVTIDATFSLEELTLIVTKAGTGTGTVTCNGTACSPSYPYDTSITLADAAATGSAFKGWSAGTGSLASVCTGTSTNPCTFTITANSAITATNVLKHTITVEPTGEGSVSANEGAISGCSASGGTCTGEYAEGAQIKLTAAPNMYYATSWTSGCTTISGNECKVTVGAANVTVKVAFAPKTNTLTVAPTGEGAVSASTGAISGCSSSGGTCAGTYEEGKPVTLTATPAPGHSFAGWSGGGCSGTGSECTIASVSAATTVNATFFVNTATLTVSSVGSGSVSANYGAISECAGASGVCAGTYDELATVTLTATPAAHQQVTWEGCESVSGDTCTVAVGAADTIVNATFTAITHTLTVAPTGSGFGSVSASTGVVSGCSSGGGTCTGAYDEAATVTLTATPAAGSTLAWSGCTSVSGDTCTVYIGASNATVTATFTAAPITPSLPVKSTPPAQEGKLTMSAAATVTGGKAALKLSCSSAGVCKGTLKLTIEVKQGHKTKTVAIGSASYSIAAGKSATIKVKLSSAAEKLLKRGETLKAKLTAPSLTEIIKLKLSHPKKK